LRNIQVEKQLLQTLTIDLYKEGKLISEMLHYTRKKLKQKNEGKVREKTNQKIVQCE